MVLICTLEELLLFVPPNADEVCGLVVEYSDRKTCIDVLNCWQVELDGGCEFNVTAMVDLSTRNFP